MVIRTSPFRVPFPRRVLLRIHKDLFRIENSYAGSIDLQSKLSLVEIIILVSEDRRFFRHNGVDYKACARELFKAATARRFSGGSTIDMQFVRTATGYYDRNIRRKTYEMLLAWLIQHRFSKIEIFRRYLSIAFFGSHLYGIESASDIMFSKPSTKLSEQESAKIAAMLIYPRPLARIIRDAPRLAA
jgi:monofunctional glycosyltransferase